MLLAGGAVAGSARGQEMSARKTQRDRYHATGSGRPRRRRVHGWHRILAAIVALLLLSVVVVPLIPPDSDGTRAAARSRGGTPASAEVMIDPHARRVAVLGESLARCALAAESDRGSAIQTQRRHGAHVSVLRLRKTPLPRVPDDPADPERASVHRDGQHHQWRCARRAPGAASATPDRDELGHVRRQGRCQRFVRDGVVGSRRPV